MGSCLTSNDPPPTEAQKSLEEYAKVETATHIVPSTPNPAPEIFQDEYLLKDMESLLKENIEELIPLQRIKHIICHYINLNEEKDDDSESNSIYSYINNELGNSYNNSELLNDYYYILYNYDNKLEEINNYLLTNISNINPNNISYFNRNYRNRCQGKNSTENIYVSNDLKEINTIQIMDRIYCYFIYTFSMGNRFRKNDIYEYNESNDMKEQKNNYESIDDIIRDNNIFEMNEIVKERRTKNDQLNGCKYQKYKYYINMGSNNNELNNANHTNTELKPIESSHISTSLDMMIDRIPTNQSSIDYTQSTTHSSLKILPNMESLGGLQKSASIKLFQRAKSISQRTDYNDTMIIGYRYYYWNYFERHNKKDENNPGYTCKDWYIQSKYATLKNELLENEKGLNLNEYNEIYNKSLDIINCIYTKQISNNYYWYTREYGLDSGLIITLEHIIAMSVYCNCYNIQSVFNNTFYRTSVNETDIELKVRHGIFYNLGKLIRECVECFGCEITKAPKNTKFYVILNENMLFGQIYAKISIPLCSSTENGVIMNYINNNNNENENGLMLEISGDKNNACDFFDCKFVSDFANEKQVLFIGGFERLKFNTIINVNKGINYGIYLKAISVINSIIKETKKGILQLNALQFYYYNNKKLYAMIKEIIINLLRNELKRKHSIDNKEEEEEDDDDDVNDYKYVNILFNYYCLNIYKIKLDLNKIKNEYSFLCNVFGIETNENQQWCDINIILKLFPNINYISINGINKLTQNMLNEIYNNIIQNQSLFKLVLNYSNINEQILNKMLNNNIQKFQEKQWKIIKKYRSLNFEKIHL